MHVRVFSRDEAGYDCPGQPDAHRRPNTSCTAQQTENICKLTCAATLIQYISILILIGYLAFVLKIDFGNQLGYILLASFAGCCTGVSFGAMVGALSKKGEGVKTGIIISLSMLMSFLAGLMVAQVKYEAVKKPADTGLHQSGQSDCRFVLRTLLFTIRMDDSLPTSDFFSDFHSCSISSYF